MTTGHAAAEQATERRDALVTRVFQSILGVMDLLNIYLGDRLGLYRALAEGGPMTSAELAVQASIHERYAREWLEQQAVAGILDVDDVVIAPQTVAVRPEPVTASRVLGHSDELVGVWGVLVDQDRIVVEGAQWRRTPVRVSPARQGRIVAVGFATVDRREPRLDNKLCQQQEDERGDKPKSRSRGHAHFPAIAGGPARLKARPGLPASDEQVVGFDDQVPTPARVRGGRLSQPAKCRTALHALARR